MFSVGIENTGGNFKMLYSDSNDNGCHMLGDTSEASCHVTLVTIAVIQLETTESISVI